MYSDYSTFILAAVWSIAQTGLHLGWCIWGIYLYECKYELEDDTFGYFFYLVYFYKNSCVNATLKGLTTSSDTRGAKFTTIKLNDLPYVAHNQNDFFQKTVASNIHFPSESHAAERTYFIFTAFLIIDSIWLITAIILLIGACLKIKDHWAIIFYLPWTFVLFIVLLFDAVTAGWYGIDISYTNSLPKWYIFIGGNNANDMEELSSQQLKVSTALPSLFMMLVFCRFFVIWCANLFLFFRIVQATLRAVQNLNGAGENNESKRPAKGHAINAGDIKRPHNFQVHEVSRNRVAGRIRRWQLAGYGSDDDIDEKDERERVRRLPRRCSKQKQTRTNDSAAFQFDKDTVEKYLSVAGGGYEGDRSSSPSPQPYYDRKQIRNPYNNQQGARDERDKPDAFVQLDCVREQLPWSYFNDQPVLKMPKGRKYVIPPVPVPDYNVRLYE